MQILFIMLLLTSGCQIEPQSSEDKSLLKAGGKTVKGIKELSNAMLPRVKTIVKSGAASGDYGELITLLKTGKTEGKAAARAFKMLVKEPLVDVDDLVSRLKVEVKSSPLAAKGNSIVSESLSKKLDVLNKAVEEHNKALAALKKHGINTRDLRVKVEVQEARKWKGALKNDYPDLFEKVSSLEIPVNRTNDALAGAAAVALPFSLKEFMASEEY